MASLVEQTTSDQLMRQVYGTICYFDLFARPLTAFEVWYNLLDVSRLDGRGVFEDASFVQVERVLREMAALGALSYSSGYYFLAGRDDTVAERRDRFLIGKSKWDRAVFAARLLRFVPFVQFVAVCNTLAIDAAKSKSDIDLLIGVTQGHIWTTRFFVTLLTQLFGIRRHGKHVANRICLSFYLTPDAYDLSQIALKPFDLYLSYYVTEVAMLFAVRDARQEFERANQWFRVLLPHAQAYEVAWPRQVLDSRISFFVRRSFELIGNSFLRRFFEKIMRSIQMRKMKTHPLYQNHDENAMRNQAVVVSDSMLKFHEEDRRAQFSEEFFQRYSGFDQVIHR